MQVSRVFTGVDGGSTKTLAVSADEKGRILGIGESGPSNYHVVGLERAIKNINESITKSINRTNIKAPKITTLGLAGMDTTYDFQFFKKEALSKILGEKVYVRHDAEIALVGATKGEPGVIIIAGTGSVAGGRDRNGRYLRCGGWGYMLGDEGSAYFLGKKCLTAVLWAYDGRGEETMLTEMVLKKLRITSVEDIIKKVYVEKMSVRDIAKLAPLVPEAAQKGDKVAQTIIREAVHNLVLHVLALVRRLELDKDGVVKVAPIGGVFRAGRIILEPFKKELNKHFRVEVIKPSFPPAVGALLLSYMFGEIKLDDELLSNIKNTLTEFNVYV